MKVSQRLIVSWFLFLLSSCQYVPNDWNPIYPEEDYDLIRYDSQENRIWASNNYSDVVVSIGLGKEYSAQLPVKKILLPDNLSLNTLCVSKDVWIIAEYKLLKYLAAEDVWDRSFSLGFDKTYECQVLENGVLLFFGEKKEKNIMAIYRNENDIDFVELLPNTKDINQDYFGEIWLITSNNGLWKLDKNLKWVYWDDVTGDQIFFTEPAILWIAKNRHLYFSSLDHGIKLKPVENFDYDLSTSVYQGNDGRIWIVSQSGIWEYIADEVRRIEQPNNIKHINIIHAFDPGLNILFVSTENGIYSVSLKK